MIPLLPPADGNPTRRGIYYWKCDRPAAFHGVLRPRCQAADEAVLAGLQELLSVEFPGPLELKPAAGEGTHRTYLLHHAEAAFFVRVEDGPEGDVHLDIESQVIAAVAKTGVPVPRVRFTDTSRQRVPFAVQAIEFFECPDLNLAHRQGRLNLVEVAEKIGQAVARWQTVPVRGFGPIESQRPDGSLQGCHAAYGTYFQLHLERHLHLLEADGFLSGSEVSAILGLMKARASLLEFGEGCLVHKDLALWNILGVPGTIRAFIDWDDAIAGDPTDDLSLLACFHPAEVVQAAVRGYKMARPLPERFLQRFWLHLLRNMIVKAVIRCGAGYFEETSTNFLLLAGQDGAALKTFTRERLLAAYHGLIENRSISHL